MSDGLKKDAVQSVPLQKLPARRGAELAQGVVAEARNARQQRRRDAILHLITKGVVRTQDQLQYQLETVFSIGTTQGTLSRDLKELGIVRHYDKLAGLWRYRALLASEREERAEHLEVLGTLSLSQLRAIRQIIEEG